MKLNSKLKNSLRIARNIYLTAYLGVTTHIGYDFFANNKQELKTNGGVEYNLQVQKYDVDINGQKKKLTLVGETHYYNRMEHETGKKLVEEHNNFANEIGKGTNIPFMDKVFFTPFSALHLVSSGFSRLGDGRIYSSISEIAEDSGQTVYALEEDPFIHMSVGEKLGFGILMSIEFLVAPINYYASKNETSYNPRDYDDFVFRESMIDKRDSVMAQGLIKLLSKDNVDNLLATVGGAHVEGIVKNLLKNVELNEIKNTDK